jgi:hypothetical protein
VTLLAETIEEVRLEVETEIAFSTSENAERRRAALELVSYKLERLSAHMTASRRILNDLRMLRRVLLGETKPLARRASSTTAG